MSGLAPSCREMIRCAHSVVVRCNVVHCARVDLVGDLVHCSRSVVFRDLVLCGHVVVVRNLLRCSHVVVDIEPEVRVVVVLLVVG